ncbi:MAG: PilX N-terminal domain-containing pilus assembly protein [Pseudomonadales bacterium]|nr:PilX N-terminal domain-containing pilus assembly protein [Pseudomonadales bacterium]
MISSKKNQSGVALIVSLVILLAIMLLGVSSLRSGFFHERMSMNSQADALTFMGAESGINGVMSFAWQIGDGAVDESFFADTILFGQAQSNCVTKGNIVPGWCANASQAFDTRPNGVLFVQSSTSYNGSFQVENSDASVFRDHKFTTVGTSYFLQNLNLPFATENLQEWKKLGVGNGPFSMGHDEMRLALGIE